MLDVSHHFFEEKPLYGLRVYSKHGIENDDERLLDIIKLHLHVYYATLLEIINIQNSNLITEWQVIDYLNTHIDLKERYEAVFCDEVSLVQDFAPSIVESWNYYKAFKGDF